MKFLSVFLIALLLIQAYFTSAKSLSSITNGGGHSEFTQTIDCSEACSRRCSQSSRQNECHRACKSCCAKCNCVPPGTYGNKDRCPCYANLKTHENKNKCP